MTRSITGYAPGSIGNVGPGLDILGLAIAGRGDRVTLVERDDYELVISSAGHIDLPTDPGKNTAAVAVAAVRRVGGNRQGFTIAIEKGLPLSGGQGGSAASAVAAAVAADKMLELGLDMESLLECALEGEAMVAGRHLDNLAPALLGGFVLVRSLSPIDVVRLPVPEIRLVLVQPEQRMRTKDARGLLPDSIPRAVAIDQAANISAMVAGACLGDVGLFGRAIEDRIAEPVRGPTLIGFVEARKAALAHGALGCSISGAGPTSFAVAENEQIGANIGAAMVEEYRKAGVSAVAFTTTVDRQGARIE